MSFELAKSKPENQNQNLVIPYRAEEPGEEPCCSEQHLFRRALPRIPGHRPTTCSSPRKIPWFSPGFVHFSLGIDLRLSYWSPKDGASISQRTVQIQCLAVQWGIIRS